MKALKILIALCIMLGFATNVIKAQAVQAAQHSGYTWDEIGINIVCTNEAADGEDVVSFLVNNNMAVMSISGTYTGVSGTVYKTNYERKDIEICNKGEVASTNVTFQVHADGKLIGKGSILVHVTIDTNGIPRVALDRVNWVECFNR